ncbi:helix-hairpin-helix domain-containing protein [Thalassomonas viridans]|uniref:Helix-hairpin-helix domain-containing protein n=1 Tax=Thalassomonas viridans TaxID=137584 RepID=A0AAE9YZ10_9GAMM|nr:helix-hairpin-helix domain-containing protein [Thalassomonas viridans]
MKNILSLLLIALLTCFSAMSVAGQKQEQAKVVDVATQTVDINQASLDDLVSLKGVGLKRAKAIIAYRETNGKFTTLDELLKVKGIGAKVLADNIQRLKI